MLHKLISKLNLTGGHFFWQIFSSEIDLGGYMCTCRIHVRQCIFQIRTMYCGMKGSNCVQIEKLSAKDFPTCMYLGWPAGLLRSALPLALAPNPHTLSSRYVGGALEASTRSDDPSSLIKITIFVIFGLGGRIEVAASYSLKSLSKL